MDEKKRYIFKKDYVCSFGKINEGREITYFNNMFMMDGIIIPKPYDNDIKALLEDDNFIKEYIKVENAIKNKI